MAIFPLSNFCLKSVALDLTIYLFAGGELDQDDMDEMMKAIQDAYWIAKEKNKKYASKG